MAAALDKAPHVLIMELHERGKNAEALSRSAVETVEQAGATCERLIVMQAQDLVLAAQFAAKSSKFDAMVALAEIDGTKGKRRLITDGLQKVSLQERLAIGHGLIEPDEKSPAEVGGAAADSALRLFAIKARFNPMLNES